MSPPTPFTIWITGLSASGKTTLGSALSRHLTASDRAAVWLDGEEIRRRLDRPYGFTREERVLVVDKIGEMAAEANGDGQIAVVSTTSHVLSSRKAVRKRLQNFFEIYLKCPPQVCAARDYKGQYRRAFDGEIDNFVGVTEPYEESSRVELVIDTAALSADEALAAAVAALADARVLPPPPPGEGKLTMPYERTIVFVSGSPYSGKSRLGHMLATDEHCLFSYATSSPGDFFDRDGRLLSPSGDTLGRLVKLVRTICGHLSGEVVGGRRWLGDDQLAGYDYGAFAQQVEKGISPAIDAGGFYRLWDSCLQAARRDGEKSTYTVVETENAHDPRLVSSLRRAIPNARVFVVLRAPGEQFLSLKADILVRGPRDPSSPGVLSGRRNLLGEYIHGLQDSTRSLARGYAAGDERLVMPVVFKDLHHLSEEGAAAIAEFIHGAGPRAEALTGHLIAVSNPSSPLTNRYLSLDSQTQSFFTPERQTHLPVTISKTSPEKFMAGWETALGRLHAPVHEYLTGVANGLAPGLLRGTLQLPAVLAGALLFGVKEVRTGAGMRQRLRFRRHGVTNVLRTAHWLVRLLGWQLVGRRLSSRRRSLVLHRATPPDRDPGARRRNGPERLG